MRERNKRIKRIKPILLGFKSEKAPKECERSICNASCGWIGGTYFAPYFAARVSS